MRTVALVGVVVWTLAVGVGVREIYAYATEPGAQSGAPAQWPEDSTLPITGKPAIVMFVHPECPCTRASLAELEGIARHVGDRATITIVSDGTGTGWDRAARVANATRVLDPLGTEAKRFGAYTSGHVVVYDEHRVHRFAGGVTGSRGHVGANVGRELVQEVVDGVAIRDLAHAVFGCAL